MVDPKEAAFAAWRAFGSRDADAIRAVLTEDVQWLAPPRNATQVALGLEVDQLETREGIIQFLTVDMRRLFPDGVDLEFTLAIAEGQTVVFEERMRGTTLEGRSYDNVYCWVFVMRDGRVCQMREYMDTLKGKEMIFGDREPTAIAPIVP